MKNILIFCSLLFFAQAASAQFAPGTVAPDFTVKDLNGNSWHLYDILNQGKAVVLDISATWCGPCWNYHNTGNLETLYEQYGPNGTNELMVLFIEGDPTTTIDNLHGIGSNTQGDWVTGTPYPIVDDDVMAHNYGINYFPTIYYICPDRLTYEIGQLPFSSIHNYVSTCAKAEGQNNASALKYEGPEGSFCEKLKFSPSFYLQNMGIAALQSAKIDLLLNGVATQSISWTGNLSTFMTELLSFQEISVESDLDLSIHVSLPNNSADEVPGNDALETSLFVSPSVEQALLDLEIKFDNFPTSIYWELTASDGTLLYYGGNPRAKYPNVPVGNDYTTPNTIVHHSLAVPADGCYQFGIYDVIGDGICCGNGQGYYKLKDMTGNIVVQGAVFGSFKIDPFGIQNSNGTKNNASILSLEGLENDFCDQYVVSPIVEVLNNGNNSITSIDFDISGNNNLYKSEHWTGAIPPGTKKKFTLGPVTLTQTDNIKVALVQTNEQLDTFSYKNNVSQKITRRSTPKSSWIVDIITDLHGWQTYWQLSDDQGAILASGGNPIVGINGGGKKVATAGDLGAYQPYQHIQQTVNLPANGCYHFNVVDDGGDGMLLNSFGNPTAFARIRNPQVGIITGTNGDFYSDYKSNIAFETAVATEEPDLEGGVFLFPNPASSEIQVSLSAGAAEVSLFNSLGQLIWETKKAETACIIPLKGVADGLYYVRVLRLGQSAVKSVSVQR